MSFGKSFLKFAGVGAGVAAVAVAGLSAGSAIVQASATYSLAPTIGSSATGNATFTADPATGGYSVHIDLVGGRPSRTFVVALCTTAYSAPQCLTAGSSDLVTTDGSGQLHVTVVTPAPARVDFLQLADQSDGTDLYQGGISSSYSTLTQYTSQPMYTTPSGYYNPQPLTNGNQVIYGQPLTYTNPFRTTNPFTTTFPFGTNLGAFNPFGTNLGAFNPFTCTTGLTFNTFGSVNNCSLFSLLNNGVANNLRIFPFGTNVTPANVCPATVHGPFTVLVANSPFFNGFTNPFFNFNNGFFTNQFGNPFFQNTGFTTFVVTCP